jgi:hypothetical protein
MAASVPKRVGPFESPLTGRAGPYMSLPDKFIVFLGRTFSGHNHDDRMLKQEFPPELDWLTDLHVRVD